MIEPNSASTTKGSAAPMSSPARMPSAATARICVRLMANTVPPGAPRAFSVARLGRLRSTAADTALATPTPPTTSDVRPTRVRNWVSRERLRSNSGDTLRRVRTSQPACGNCAFTASTSRVRPVSPTGAVPSPAMATRVLQRTREVGPASAAALSAAMVVITRGPSAMPPASLSGSETSVARMTKRPSPSLSTSPGFTSRRAARVGSATRPKLPSGASAKAVASGIGGSSTTSPVRG